MDGFDGFDPIPLAPLDDQPEPRRRVDLVPAASLRIEPIRWLWRHWLAAGKLHILAGAPGVAKTTLALSLIAVVSRGGAWPDGSPAAPGRCVIWSGEDDPADTLAPRLIAAGADMTRVHFVGDVLDLGERRAFDPAADMPALAEAIRDLRDVRLLLIDPIVSAVAGDDHKNAATRRSLQPLKDLAAATGAAIVGIRTSARARSPTRLSA
jgi:putative DNA primase/helicase